MERTGSLWTSIWTVRSTAPTWRCSPFSSAANPEPGPAGIGLVHFGRRHVVEETEGHSLARLREILRQRWERAAGPDGVRRRLIERRHLRGSHRQDLRDAP